MYNVLAAMAANRRAPRVPPGLFERAVRRILEEEERERKEGEGSAVSGMGSGVLGVVSQGAHEGRSIHEGLGRLLLDNKGVQEGEWNSTVSHHSVASSSVLQTASTASEAKAAAAGVPRMCLSDLPPRFLSALLSRLDPFSWSSFLLLSPSLHRSALLSLRSLHLPPQRLLPLPSLRQALASLPNLMELSLPEYSLAEEGDEVLRAVAAGGGRGLRALQLDVFPGFDVSSFLLLDLVYSAYGLGSDCAFKHPSTGLS